MVDVGPLRLGRRHTVLMDQRRFPHAGHDGPGALELDASHALKYTGFGMGTP
jgi:hypothetical protein